MADDRQQQDVVFKIFKLLREKGIKILMTIRFEEKIRWKELQATTKLTTATFNRALTALQEVNFIKKEGSYYMLTWTGKLVTDGLALFGYRMSEDIEDVDDTIAEGLLAKDMVMIMIFLLFVSLKKRGKMNLQIFEKELLWELNIMHNIFSEYEKEGYLAIDGDMVYAKEKIKDIDISSLFT